MSDVFIEPEKRAAAALQWMDAFVEREHAQHVLKLSAQDYADIVDGKRQLDNPLLLVDCRPVNETSICRMPLAAGGEATTQAAVEALDSDAKQRLFCDHFTVAHCTIGARSARFARDYSTNDNQIYNLHGSMISWAHLGRMFVDANGEATRRFHSYNQKFDRYRPDSYEGYYEGMNDQSTWSYYTNYCNLL